MKLSSIASSPEREVSHNPVIKKHVLIDNGQIERITNFSRAVFPPGETAPLHAHTDMTEVFYIESGCGEMEVDGQCVSLPAGTCITVEPGEAHELRNVGGQGMVVLYFGVVVSL